MSVIPVAGVERTASHPAWTPVSVDGSIITGATVGDDQAFGIGVADQAVGGNTFKGDSGQMITISGYNTADTIEDFTGDGDSATQMRSVDLEVPGTRQLSFTVPAGWEWMAKFFQTVFRDANKRPDDHRGHLRHGRHRLAAVSDRVAVSPHRGQGRTQNGGRPDSVRCGDRDWSGLMGWAPNRITINLNDRLSKLAGAKIVTCRYLGPKQQGKIDLDIQMLQAEHRKLMGAEWAGRLVDAVGVDADTQKKQEAEAEADKNRDPEKWALDRWPQVFVCQHAIKAFDGESVDVDKWLDDGPSPAVTKHIALTVLRESELIPETETDRGEDLGGSLDS